MVTIVFLTTEDSILSCSGFYQLMATDKKGAVRQLLETGLLNLVL